MSDILIVKTPDFDYSCTTLADWRKGKDSCMRQINFKIRDQDTPKWAQMGFYHPIVHEVASFFRGVDKAQKLGIEAVRELQENLKNPVKKANGKKIPPRPAAVKSHVPVVVPVVTPEPVTRPVPAFGSPEVVVMVKYPTWPGWQTVKALRANGWRWNAKARAHEKTATAEILNSIN